MDFFSGARLKKIAYTLELLLLFILQHTPGLIPKFLGTSPLILIIAAISIAVFEGESYGMWFGLFAGFLMDCSSSHVFGFYMMLCVTICYVCGMLVSTLMRSNLVTAMILGAGGLTVVGLFQWFFFYALWSDPKTGFYLYAIMLPQIVYTALLMPIVFYFNRAVSYRLTPDE